MNPPNCLVCGAQLSASGGDVNMYYCTKRKIYMPEWKCHLDVTDTVIYIDPDKHRETMWVVEIPPYRFTMTDFPRGPRTEVHKTVLPDFAPWDREVENIKLFLYKKLILEVPALMKLPWHDKAKVLERLKLYMLFS